MEPHTTAARLTLYTLPTEVVYEILEIAAELNSREIASYVFGMSKASTSGDALDKYVRAPMAPDILRWDSACEIRQVCSSWHAWALKYALKDIYFQEMRGTERWAELPHRRGKQSLVFFNL